MCMRRWLGGEGEGEGHRVQADVGGRGGSTCRTRKSGWTPLCTGGLETIQSNFSCC